MACHNIAMTNKPRKRAGGAGRKPKGPISGNAGWLQARITEDLRSQLEEAAARNGRSLSQEAQVRLKDSFGLSAKLQAAWGPPEVKALAYLVSRVVRSVQAGAGANPFFSAGELAWHHNPFTHAAVCAAIITLLDHFKPEGLIQTPPRVKESAERMPEQAQPESMGRSIAMGLLLNLATAEPPPKNADPNAHYSDNRRILPDIQTILGDIHDD
jgi:TraY domain